MPLTTDERERYARHLSLPQVGAAGQERLRAGSVLIIGLGGLGSPAALYLAAAGVGRLGLLDHDQIAVHNLQRQVLHDTAGIGTPKVASARARLEALNPGVALDTWDVALTRDNARGIVAGYDVVIDGTDSFTTRYLINDACVLERRPLIQASVHRFEGQLSVFATADGPCYRCLHPEPPPPGSVPNCADGGVLGVLPGLLGTLQATEALKWLLGIGEPLVGRLLAVDALTMRITQMRFDRDPGCAWCATRSATALLDDYAAFCGEAPAAAVDDAARDIDPAAAAAALARGALYLLDVREDWELDAASVPGAMHVAMGLIPAQQALLPRDKPIAVLCHHGMRSAMVADYLRAAGHRRVLNVRGGIDRWSVEADAQVPRY
ncbi:MAG TPA: molybdopterin-synthase adenylyltransferase MoeB [Gemmatimonadaceae bacterium]|nr:molybdopterin-synthase adenylyltransferase MoeB [Gemmatimonadaceae bacterium]